jgi:hypothetical protein
MGKMIGFLLLVVGVWVGLEVYQHGVQGAFGGALASFGSESASAPRDSRSAPQRAGAAVQQAHTEAEARRARLLAD